MARAYLGLGANQGDREANLRGALARLAQKGRLVTLSSLYQTKPVGYLEQPDFLNACCALETELSARELLSFVKTVEAEMGRRPSFPNAPRPIDIDILLYDSQVVAEPGLAIPHPRMHQRSFVLVPLAEIAPRVLHPTSGKRVAELLAALPDKAGVASYRACSSWPGMPPPIDPPSGAPYTAS